MPTLKSVQFSIEIAAPPKTVYETMTGKTTYSKWTAAFSPGSSFVGSWDEGAEIRFVDETSGCGMVSEIAANRPAEYVSIRHLGMVENGVVDTTSEKILAWAPAYENYTYEPTPTGTRVLIDMQVSPDWADYMADTWPKALDLLKALCESP